MTICVFGDSIAWGAFDMKAGGWISRLMMYGNEHYDSEIYNLGVSADTTIEILQRFESESDRREPGALIFAIGINDAMRIGPDKRLRVPHSQFKKNIQRLSLLANRQVGKVVFVGCTSVDEKKTTPVSWKWDDGEDIFYFNADVEECNKVLNECAHKSGDLFVSMNASLVLEDFEDGLHPNTKGHEKMFEHIKNELENHNVLTK